MPQLGETVTEGTIVRWLKQVGDAVAVDDPLFEVSTDKVDTEVPSAFAGYLRAILVAEGDTVPIGTPLGLAHRHRRRAGRRRSTGAAGARSRGTAADAADRGRRRRPSPTAAGNGVPADPPAGEVALSPVVRRLLDEHGLDPGQVVGLGAATGRITRSDVLAAAANGAARSTAAPHRRRPRAAVPSPAPTTSVVDFTRARRATADNMLRSLATSAHTLVVIEVDYTAVDRRPAGGRADVPALRGPGRGRRHPRVPPGQRQRRRRRARSSTATSTSASPSTSTSRRWWCRCVSDAGEQRLRPLGRGDRRPGRRGPGPSASPPTTSPAPRSPSPTSVATARSSPRRSSTSRRWRSCPPTASAMRPVAVPTARRRRGASPSTRSATSP